MLVNGKHEATVMYNGVVDGLDGARARARACVCGGAVTTRGVGWLHGRAAAAAAPAHECSRALRVECARVCALRMFWRAWTSAELVDVGSGECVPLCACALRAMVRALPPARSCGARAMLRSCDVRVCVGVPVDVFWVWLGGVRARNRGGVVRRVSAAAAAARRRAD